MTNVIHIKTDAHSSRIERRLREARILPELWIDYVLTLCDELVRLNQVSEPKSTTCRVCRVCRDAGL
jgi:hypothetical protein